MSIGMLLQSLDKGLTYILICSHWMKSQRLKRWTVTRRDFEPQKAVDQAALRGMLNHIRDLGLPLLAVDQVEENGST